ncbi:MAG: VOC family protein [Cytophagales bacterium]|nr:VOC family protein [Bernardetiaceae bacterium]MDW8204754.1 VOC family protein [Cytophagales bacterium]
MQPALITGTLQAVSIVTHCWHQSLRFYTDALGYPILQQGLLSLAQRQIFGMHLTRYALLGYEQGSVIRLLETSLSDAVPNRLGARPWDLGMAVVEAGTPDVEAVYYRVLRNRFGAISEPAEFEAEGPEPLGWVMMKSAAFLGPAGEQLFVTQIVRRKGGASLLKESAVKGVNAPANVVISMKDRSPIEIFWHPILGISPVNDLPMCQPLAAKIMGGPSDMGFDMLLMGHGSHRIGMEQHVYAPYNPTYDYKAYPCTFEKTGLASACWQSPNLDLAAARISAAGFEIISRLGLPMRQQATPEAVVFRGPLGEIVELVSL